MKILEMQVLNVYIVFSGINMESYLICYKQQLNILKWFNALVHCGKNPLSNFGSISKHKSKI